MIIIKQEAQLSQRDRAMLRDMEYFADTRGYSRSQVPLKSLGTVSCSHSIVTMALSYIISDIKRDIRRKSRFFTPLNSTPTTSWFYRNIAKTFVTENLSGYPTVKKV